MDAQTEVMERLGDKNHKYECIISMSSADDLNEDDIFFDGFDLSGDSDDESMCNAMEYGVDALDTLIWFYTCCRDEKMKNQG